ncbi:LAMI_0H07206g1_1 [Lachancea mirantina]|uniref:LAMI_0H07206g1_1 n=1 Tax=Lachancea mirantina TaxID=1230905 RepID=A0A1G4KG45_9SACH|nr:LAMI_0H07206g1_1 [Lachancea mirantina]
MSFVYNDVYLADENETLLSKWTCIACVSGRGKDDDDSSDPVYLPPLQKPLKICITFDFGVAAPLLEQLLLERIRAGLTQCGVFWSDMGYDVQIRTASHGIDIRLECRVFGVMKVRALLEQPLAHASHAAHHVSVASVDALHIACLFAGVDSAGSSAVLRHCNEYLVSLFLSQLEFQFPLVFSKWSRSRFSQQQRSLGPVSYALTGSTELIPQLIKIISRDTTATACYQVTRLASHANLRERLQKSKKRMEPYQIVGYAR